MVDHCLNVGYVAKVLLELLSPRLRILAPSGVQTLAAWHDIGKVSPGFQIKCPGWLSRHGLQERAANEWVGAESDHAKVSQATAQRILGPELTRWAAALGAHHGRVKGQTVPEQRLWEKARIALATELAEELGPVPMVAPGAPDAETWFVAGLISIADWIGSDEQRFPQDSRWNGAQREEAARRAVSEIGWRVPVINPAMPFQDLFPETPLPNSLQSGMMAVAEEPGVYIVEGPMGFGKTEAALAAAYQLLSSGKASGIYFALPTQVTSNRIHLRMSDFVRRLAAGESVRLAHGASWLVEPTVPLFRSAVPGESDGDQDSSRAARSWFASAKRALLMPFGVGTVDQALLAVVAAKHFFVRQFALAGKVVILDEVHTYDLYTGTLVGQLVEQLRELKATVLVLSATLTESRRRELLGVPPEHAVSSAYPLISSRSATGGFHELECASPPEKRVEVRLIHEALPLDLVRERALRGECVLWIRNTVDEAQETYRLLSEVCRGMPVALMHARFPFFRREELESEWMRKLGRNSATRPRGCILVATQVVEQSVDIDADFLVTDLAPTDMILQRLGRLWRHERKDRPCTAAEIWVCTPNPECLRDSTIETSELRARLGRSGKVYAPYVLLRSFDQFRALNYLRLPFDIRGILEATYADPAPSEPAAWRDLRLMLEEKKAKLARLALSSTLVWSQPSLEDDEGIQTRYSEYPNAQLVLVRGAEAVGTGYRFEFLDGTVREVRRDSWDLATAKAIHRNVVKVPLWAIRDGLSTSPCVEKYLSGACAVGVVGRKGDLQWLEIDLVTGILYDEHQGLILRRRPSSTPDLSTYSLRGDQTDESFD